MGAHVPRLFVYILLAFTVDVVRLECQKVPKLAVLSCPREYARCPNGAVWFASTANGTNLTGQFGSLGAVEIVKFCLALVLI